MMEDIQVLAESNGYALARRGPVLLFVNRGTSQASTVGFVVALLALIIGANALVQLALWLTGTGGVLVSLALLATTALFAFGTHQLRRLLAHRSALPPEDVETLALVDLEEGLLLDADGTPLAPLASVSFSRRHSTPILTASWPGGSRVVAVGSPFGGPVTPIESALRAEGLL